MALTRKGIAERNNEELLKQDEKIFGKGKKFDLDLNANEKFIQEYRASRAVQLEKQRTHGRRPTDIPLWITLVTAFLCFICVVTSLGRDLPWSFNNVMGYGLSLIMFTGPPAYASQQFTTLYIGYNGSQAVLDDPRGFTYIYQPQWCELRKNLQKQNEKKLPYDPWCSGIPELVILLQTAALLASMFTVWANGMLKRDKDRTRYPPVYAWQIIPKPAKPVMFHTYLCFISSLVQVACGMFSMSLWTRINNNLHNCLIICFKYSYGFYFCCLGWILAFVNAVHYLLIIRQRWIIRVDRLIEAVRTNKANKVVRFTGDIEFAAILMDKLGSDGRAALHWACALSRSLLVNVLLQAGADITVRDKDSWTALHWAARMGHSTVINVLLHSGGPSIMKLRDKSGNTALMLCMGQKGMDCASYLIAAGADIDEQNLWGQTLLMMCAEEGSSANGLATVLLLHQANTMLQDRDGATVLHYAARDGNGYLIILVQQHMRRNDFLTLCRIKDRYGAKAADEATVHHHDDVYRLLTKQENDSLVEQQEKKTAAIVAKPKRRQK